MRIILLLLGIREDMERVLKDGPWKMFNLFVHLMKWTMEFDNNQDDYNLMNIWVKHC